MSLGVLQVRLEHELSQKDIKLMSQIAIDEHEYKVLCDHLRFRISRPNKLSTEPDAMLAMGLVQIAVRAYADGNYWSNFTKTLNCTMSMERRTEIGEIFRRTLMTYKLCQVDLDDDRNMIVQNIKAHSFVPDAYMDNYVEFLHSFYDRNLFCDLSDGVEHDIHALLDYLHTTLSKTDDSIEVEAHGSTPPKTYRLLASTRQAMALCDRHVITQIVLDHLNHVDAFYLAEHRSDQSNRFASSIFTWLKQNVLDIHDRRSGALSIHERGSLFRKPHFEIDAATQEPFLLIPETKMRGTDYAGSIVAKLTVDENEVEQLGLVSYRSLGFVLTEPLRLKVHDIFAEYKLVIEADRPRVFSIPAKPFRIFSKDLIESKKLRTGTNLIFVKKGFELDAGTEPVIEDKSLPNWDVYHVPDASDATMIRIGNEMLSTKEIFVDGIINNPKGDVFQALINGKPISIFTKHPQLQVITPEDLYSAAQLVCNGQQVCLSKLRPVIQPCRSEGESALSATIDLMSCLKPKSGAYRFLKDIPAKERSKLAEYIFLADFSVRFTEDRYIMAARAVAEITCDLPFKPVNGRLFKGPHQYEFDIANDATDAIIEVSLSENESVFVYVPIPVFTYSFAGQDKQVEPLNYVWFEKLKNDFIVYLPNARDILLGVNDEMKTLRGTYQRDNSVRFNLAELQAKLKNPDRIQNNLMLSYREIGADEAKLQRKSFRVFRVLTGTHVVRNYFFSEEKRLKYFIDFQGDRPVHLRGVEKQDQAETSRTFDVKLKQGVNDIVQFDPRASYSVELIEILDDGMGWGEETNHLFPPIENLLIIDPTDLSNCRIDIVRVYFAENELPIRYEYAITDLHRIDHDTYKGKTLDFGIRNMENSSSHFPFVYDVYVSLEIDELNITLKSIEIIDDNEQGDVYYDKNFRALRSPFCDDINDSRNRDRFTELYPDDVTFEIEVRRLS